MRFRVIGFILFIGFNSVFGQNIGSVNVDLNYLPEELNSVGFYNSSIEIIIPTKFQKGILINSVLYSNYRMDYPSNEILNTSSLETFKSIGYSLKYLNSINDKWSYEIIFSPTVSSNFESNLTFDDFVLNGGIVLTRKNNEKKFQIGFLNNSSFGFNTPIPLVTYGSKWGDNIYYTIGFPITKIEYQINSKNKANLYIKPKGFYANLSDAIILNSSEVAEKATYKSIISGLNFTHTIDDSWKIALDSGYQLTSDYDLLNNNKNSVYKFNTKSNFYIGLKLKFNLLKENN